MGQIVRIYPPVLSSHLRQTIKEGKQKLVVVKYSIELYRVTKKTRPRNPFLRENVNGVLQQHDMTLKTTYAKDRKLGKA